jgi:prephenate dehydratase
VRELAEDQVSPAWSGEYELYRGRGRSSFQRGWNYRGHRFARGCACLWASDIILNIQDNATNFVVIQTGGRDFPEQNPTRLIVRLDVKKGADSLGQLLEELKHPSFALTSADSGPIGTLGSHRFALIFDSPHGAELSQIQNVLRPIGALLIGAYRP